MRFFVLIFALVTVGMAVPVAAQGKLGVVNIARLLEEAPQARTAMQALQEEFAPRQRDILAQQEELNGREEKLQRDAAIMAEDQRRSAERELRDIRRELTRRQNEYLEDLNIRRNEELGRLQRALMQEVQSFAAAQSYDVILGDGVLYASSAMDVTADVLAALESSFKASSSASGN